MQSKLATVVTTSLHPDGAGRAIARGDLLLAIGDGRVLSHVIASDAVVIGRERGCDFVIDHGSISRRHAMLRIATPPTVQDLGSTNGITVQGRPVRAGEPQTLDDSGSFQIGPFAFVLVARSRPHPSLSGQRALRVDDPLPAGVPRLVHDFAASTMCILITGETGVGKEVLASTLHALSRRTGELVQLNCAALSETLLESELFGYERGAFTGAVGRKPGLIEVASNGTLLLDEIGEMPLSIQAKLLRAIERREVQRLGATHPVHVDVRFLAATNRDLAEEVAAGRFRADLYYRLDGVTLSLPPLRERPGAIVPLALRFLDAVAPAGRFTAAATAALGRHTWPGNVRELKAVVERAAVLARGGEVDVAHLAFSRPHAQPAEPPSERARIEDALAQCAGNQSRAAALLGISRTTLVTKLRVFGIARPHGKRSA
jgi:DNA-binding NtrC family response regulator